MVSLNILLADLLPQFLNLVFILILFRFYVLAGILLVLILAKKKWYNPVVIDPGTTVIDPSIDDRISSYNTTEVNFNKILTGFSKPF